MTSPITTHVLDTAKGCPGVGIRVILERGSETGNFSKVGEGMTNLDGRVSDLIAPTDLEVGPYRLVFLTKKYLGDKAFFPCVKIEFEVHNRSQHYHVPLLLSPYAYSTYRGS